MVTIGSYISSYRAEHGISLRSFAASLGLSPTYVSRLERGIGSTGKAPSPTMDVYRRVASATGITLDQLCIICEDDTITVNTEKQPRPKPELSEDEEMLIQLFRTVPVEDRQLVLGMIRAALASKGLL